MNWLTKSTEHEMPNEVTTQLGTVALALTIDRFVGEWPNALHPVVWMGHVIATLERAAPRTGPMRQLVFGAGLALAVPALFGSAAHLLMSRIHRSDALVVVLGALVLKSTFALGALGKAARAVEHALRRNALEDARFGLRSLCSRDPSRLSAPDLVAATIESVAENASDSFVAPLIYYVMFGVPGAIVYRAINTMDAMIGYHGRYEYLGKAAARLDDALNFLPARITAVLLLAAGTLRGKSVRRAWSIWRRDASTTESPNAGRPMATMAGLLGVQLEKHGCYRLGDPVNVLTVHQIAEAWRLVTIAAALAISLVLCALGARHVYGS
jgi:adenosylcobinamide-phosphate synthase